MEETGRPPPGGGWDRRLGLERAQELSTSGVSGRGSSSSNGGCVGNAGWGASGLPSGLPSIGYLFGGGRATPPLDASPSSGASTGGRAGDESCPPQRKKKRMEEQAAGQGAEARAEAGTEGANAPPPQGQGKLGVPPPPSAAPSGASLAALLAAVQRVAVTGPATGVAPYLRDGSAVIWTDVSGGGGGGGIINRGPAGLHLRQVCHSIVWT